MPDLETKIQGRVTSHLRKLGYPYIKTNSAGSRGWPDITTIINDRMVCLEMKRPGNVPTRKQQAMGEHIKANGGIWVSYDNEEYCYDLIDKIEDLPPAQKFDYSKAAPSLKGKDVVHV